MKACDGVCVFIKTNVPNWIAPTSWRALVAYETGLGCKPDGFSKEGWSGVRDVTHKDLEAMAQAKEIK